MNFVHHSSNNMLLGAPQGVSKEDCATLPATMTVADDQVTTITSWWKPTPQELEVLNSNGAIILVVWGKGHPMVYIGADASK